MEFLALSWRAPYRIAFIFLVIVIMTGEPAILSAAPSKTISEAQLSDLHAALVLKIAMFVQWPDDVIDLPDGKISLGVIGSDAVFNSFKKLENKKIKRQEINLGHLQAVTEQPASRILFLSKNNFSQVESWYGVLTISDAPNFNAQGGMIKLSIENGRPKFSINLKAAEEAGIVFSSKLLKIATIYKEDIQ